MINPAPKPPPREKKAPRPLPRSTTPIARYSWLKKSTKPIKASNDERRRRREKSYKKFLGSGVWRAIRKATFEHDNYECRLCDYVDESRTGVGLICDHTSYRRFGGQEIVGVDTRTICKTCNEKETTSKRANWAQPRRKNPHV